MSEGLKIMTYIKGAKNARPKSYFTDLIVQNDYIATACQNNLREGYVRDAIKSNTHIFVMYTERTEQVTGRRTKPTRAVVTPQPTGFILARKEADEQGPYYYIDVICAHKYGRELLNHFLTFAGNTSVALSSLPSVLSYYPKFDFEFRKSCAKDADVVAFPASLTRLIEGLKTAGGLPKTTEEVYHHDEYLDFMVELHNHDLNKRTDGDCRLKAKNFTKKKLMESDCGDEGYTMFRCRK